RYGDARPGQLAAADGAEAHHGLIHLSSGRAAPSASPGRTNLQVSLHKASNATPCAVAAEGTKPLRDRPTSHRAEPHIHVRFIEGTGTGGGLPWRPTPGWLNHSNPAAR